MGGEKTKRLVFVTVGTTSFDALVRAVDSETVQKELLAKGYTHLLIQMGRGSYLPTKSEGDCTLAVDYFTFSSSIADHLKSASLIISHADEVLSTTKTRTHRHNCEVLDSNPGEGVQRRDFGIASCCVVFGSGSIFETLQLAKPLIVVVNEDLMDNHQSELAEELANRKHLFCASPQTLHQTITNMDLNALRPYSPGDATPVAKHINRFLGFPDD